MATRMAVVENAHGFEGRPEDSHLPVGTRRPARLRRLPTSAPSGNGQPETDRQGLLLAMVPLVKRVAYEMSHHLPAHVDIDDLVSAGTLGLLDAVRKFDPSKGVKIESYARHRIRGGILDALRGLDPATRDMRRRARKVERTHRELEAKLGCPASDEEMAQALGISLKVWYRWAQEIHGLGSGGSQRHDTAPTPGALVAEEEGWMAPSQPDPFDLCYRREQRDLFRRALLCLPERERLIVLLYYQKDFTMKQIAARLELDESRVSQLHAQALQRLKAHIQASLARPRPVALRARNQSLTALGQLPRLDTRQPYDARGRI